MLPEEHWAVEFFERRQMLNDEQKRRTSKAAIPPIRDLERMPLPGVHGPTDAEPEWCRNRDKLDQ